MNHPRGNPYNRRGASGHGHPRHLKGREIGEFYRNRSKQQEAEFKKKIFRLKVPSEIVEQIQTKLKSCGISDSTDNVSKEFQTHFDYVLKTDFETFIKRNSQTDPNPPKEDISLKFLDKLIETQASDLYKDRSKTRIKLPVFDQKEKILEAIARTNVILISGDTGCGKTTQVPQYILDNFILNNKGADCRIVCTQPRRISAISVAERVAWERCEKLGSSVGYSIRLDR